MKILGLKETSSLHFGYAGVSLYLKSRKRRLES
ncbi:hypothetical protein V1477_009075 [Vespula maculifrons]|uniref:Uncharacterized protein n=1 Tax=Vespula maculifrons TaxID=7453 RepID=A0ABD2CEU7_VESMC